MAEQLSLRGYAKHRKARGLGGTTLKAVQKAAAAGRITLTADGKVADADAADREWAANTDLSRASADLKAKAVPPGQDAPREAIDEPVEGQGDPTMAGASAREKHWRAKLAELQYRQRAGELVNAAEMAAEMTAAYTTVRTKLLGVPSKAKQRLAHLTLEDLATLDDIVRGALEELVC